VNCFGRRFKDKPTLKARCKACDRDYQTKWLSVPANYRRAQKSWLKAGSDPESKRRRRDRQLKRLYGLTLDEWENNYRKQRGKCAICLRKKRLLTDHDHRTGRFRGLLCYSCNSGIGLLGDSVPNIRRLLKYLAA
jgi:hypothetical protein